LTREHFNKSDITSSSDADDSIADKAWREIQLGASGLVGGMVQGAKEAVEHPAGTILGVASTVSIGITLGMMQREAGLLRWGAQVGGAALGLSFAGDVIGSGRWGKLSDAVVDTWRSPDNFSRNVETTKSALGKFAFDTAIMTAAGIGSAKLANRYFIPRNEMTLPQILAETPKASIVPKAAAIETPIARATTESVARSKPMAATEAVARPRPVEVPTEVPLRTTNLPLPELNAEQLSKRVLQLKTEAQVQVTPKDLAAVRSDISAHGKEPIAVLTELMRQNRVLGLGEKHASPNPQRDFGAEVFPKLKEAGATHLAVEIHSSHQHILDRFQRGMPFTKADGDAIPGLLKYKDFTAILESARSSGLKIVAADTNAGHRDSHMAKTISGILEADPNSKVVFWVGRHHLASSYSYDTLAVQYLRKKYDVATVTDSIQDKRFRGMPGSAFLAASDLQAPVIVRTADAPNLAKLPSSGTSKNHGLWDYVLIHPEKYSRPSS
jgi:hypothetical protein